MHATASGIEATVPAKSMDALRQVSRSMAVGAEAGSRVSRSIAPRDVFFRGEQVRVEGDLGKKLVSARFFLGPQ